MFYFKLTVRSKSGDTKTSRNRFVEAIRAQDVGDLVARNLETRTVTSVGVTRISQAAYIRATRPGD